MNEKYERKITETINELLSGDVLYQIVDEPIIDLDTNSAQLTVRLTMPLSKL